MRKNQFLLSFVSLVVLLSMLLTSCAAPEPTKPPAPPPPAAPQPTKAPEPTKLPVQPNLNDTNPLVIQVPNDADNFEPNMISTRSDSNIAEHIFGKLIWQDEKAQWKPWMAESWKMLDDKKTWQFKLRKDITCQDGEKFNAETVKYVIERGLDQTQKWTGNTPGFVYTSIKMQGVDVVDEFTANIKLEGYEPDAPGYIAEIFMHPIKYYKDNAREKVAPAPVGCGPYKLKEWVKNDHITLERWDGYWGTKPPMKVLNFRPIPEASTAVAELLAGKVHILSNKVPPDQSKTIDASPNAQMAVVPGGRRIYIGFQQKCDEAKDAGCKAVRDVRVRQALNMGVDVQKILDALFFGQGKREGGMVNPPHKAADIKPYPYDVAKAKELLTAAGYPNGFKTTLATPNGRYTKDKDIALAVAQDLAKIGVQAEVVPYEWSVYTPMIRSKNLPALFLLGSGSSFMSAWYDLSDLNSVAASTNYVNWPNDEWDKLVVQLKQTVDTAERKKITDRLQMIVHDDAPWLFIYMQVDWYAKVKNVNWDPRPDEIMDFMKTNWK